MEERKQQTFAVNSINIVSSRFASSFVQAFSIYDYCLKLARSKRITGQIIQKLSSLGIDE
jgi:hypothetical protein